MSPTDRRRLLAWAGAYAGLGLGWAAVGRWAVEPMLAAAHPGPMALAIKAFLHVPPVLFLTQDPIGQWREFSGAVLIALAMHATIVGRFVLDRTGRAGGGPAPSGGLDAVLAVVAAPFLAVAVLTGYWQDYFFYEEIWYHVLHGQDPWFRVQGMLGHVPLNAYGPLFNLLAGPAWINPKAPRLICAYAYLLFAVGACRGFAAGRPGRWIRWLGPIALFANPYPWIEAAYYGHFDVMVALAVLGAVRARERGRDALAGASLAAGVLLKYLPIAVLPLLALDSGGERPRVRRRLVEAALLGILGGMGISVLIWGWSTFAPVELAATRTAAGASLAWALRGLRSPLRDVGVMASIETLSTLAQLAALAAAWRWSRARRPDIEAVVLVAVLGVVVFYRVGYPQYQFSPFLLGWAWLLAHWDRLRLRAAPTVAIWLYDAWIGVLDACYVLDDAWQVRVDWARLQDTGGLWIFALGLAVAACVVRAAPALSEVREAAGPGESGQ